MTKIGLLHPGEMGVSIGASAIQNGHPVYWASQGRSEKTRQRAQKHGLVELDSLRDVCQTCDILFSICPPHAAEHVAQAVSEQNFQGYYLDANAISPQRAQRIGTTLARQGIRFIDGGIIGGPAWKPKETWLYLAGEDANTIVDCFSKGPLETKIIGHEIGKASALKMCYAAYSKGTTALLAGILAAAEALGVRNELYGQWNLDDANFSTQVDQRTTRVTAKAWRFEGEMQEIAVTFRQNGLPSGFHEAAAEIYHRMAAFKDATEVPVLTDVLDAILEEKNRP